MRVILFLSGSSSDSRIQGDLIFRAKIVTTAVRIFSAAVVLIIIYVFQAHILIALAAVAITFAISHVIAVTQLDKIESLVKSQKLFVSNIQHELRGPLAVMQYDNELALQNLSLTEITERKSQELINAVKSDLEGLRQMSNIIKNLSLLVAQEYDAERPELKKMDLSVLLQRMCIVAENKYGHAKNIDVRLDSTAPAYVLGNASALEQVIMNLLTNAIKYSPAGTTVVASTSSSDTGTALSIRDQGIGISSQDLPHILNPFYRAQHASAIINEKGTGLGLAIVAALAKQHKAVVTIASELKRGTTVTLNFPLIPETI